MARFSDASEVGVGALKLQQMWTVRTNYGQAGTLQVALDLDTLPATYIDVIRAWQSEAEFRSLFNSLLADTPYSAFRWETPSVTTATLTQPFEFVLLDSPSLARRPDPTAFEKYFDPANDGVSVFPNLGGDAIMVVPCPIGDPTAYGHLGAFVRNAPEPQRDTLWKAVGETMLQRVSSKPVWLSTAGAGVSWLHVRLDDRPKYYGHRPYTRLPKTNSKQ